MARGRSSHARPRARGSFRSIGCEAKQHRRSPRRVCAPTTDRGLCILSSKRSRFPDAIFVMKKLIISPQAGLGNRLRALCSAKVLGRFLDREVFHYWVKDKKNASADR